MKKMQINSLLLILAFFAVTLAPICIVVSSSYFPTFVVNMLKSQNSSERYNEKIRLKSSIKICNSVLQKYSNALYRCGISPNITRAVIGKDGWVFLNSLNKSYDQGMRRHVMSEDEQKQWIENVTAYHKLAEKYSAKMYFIIAPAKWSIYPDKLPSTPDFSKLTTGEQISPKAPSFVIFPYSILKEGRKKADTYSKLNTHWTDYGASLVWNSLADRFEKEINGFKAWRFPKSTPILTSSAGNEYLATMNLNVENNWTYLTPQANYPSISYRNNSSGGYKKATWHPVDILDMPVDIVSPQATSSKKLLVIGDSQTTALSPLFNASFKEVHYKYFYASHYEKYLQEYKPDVVIIVMTERYFSQVYDPPRLYRATNKLKLDKLKTALEQYHKRYGCYPRSQGWSGYKSKIGYSGENWIPGLVPEFLEKLPRDERNNNENWNQFLYFSNGTDFKLISFNSPDFEYIKDKYPSLLDPQRLQLQCYGYWSANGRNF